MKQKPIVDFGALLIHIREIRAELAQLSTRVDGLERKRKPAAPKQTDQNLLHDAISNSYNTAELRFLATKLDIPFEDIKGDGRTEAALNLVLFMRRRGQLSALISVLTEERPHVCWSNYQ
ncbi:MAG: hypothetical protein IAF02_16485 [Anaerolineae bacterium]|nr:hypothetical protein [Anaerolineae bacterium]